jgi:hypothetical protein
VAVKPVNNLTLSAAWYFFWRETTHDAVYIEPFTPVPGTAGHGGAFIGHQVALEAIWQIDRHVQALASYVHFSAGDGLRAGGGRDVDFTMLSLGYRF